MCITTFIPIYEFFYPDEDETPLVPLDAAKPIGDAAFATQGPPMQQVAGYYAPGAIGMPAPNAYAMAMPSHPVQQVAVPMEMAQGMVPMPPIVPTVAGLEAAPQFQYPVQSGQA